MDRETAIMLSKVRDIAESTGASLTALAEEMTTFLKASAPSLAEIKKGYNVENIMWDPAEGGKGPFELCNGDRNQGVQDYKDLLAHVKSNNGRMRRDGYFYWLMSDDKSIGRKKTRFSDKQV